MSNEFRLQARNHDGKRIHLSWGKTADVLIERSKQRAGPFTEIAELGLSSQYIDTPPLPRNSRDEIYYQIRPGDFTLRDENGDPILDDEGEPMTTAPDAEYLDSIGPVKAEKEVGSRTAYVRLQAERHLRRVGEKAHLFEEQTGTRCPDCWDDIRKVRERSDCSTCGGSGYLSGWSTPIEIRMSFGTGEPEPKQTQGGELETMQLQCWAGAIPEIDIGDHVVRDRDREVFRVVKRQPTRKEGHNIRQNVICKMVEHGAEERSVADELSA